MSGRLAPVRSACNFGASLKCPNILNLYAERCRHESRASAEEGRKGCLAYSSIVQVRRCHSTHPAIDGRKFLQRHKDWLAHDLPDVPSSLGHANSGRRSPLLAYPCQLVRQASAWPLGHCHITRISVSSVCSQLSGILDSRCMKGVCRALQGAHSGNRLGLLASERVRQLQ